jgi:peptidoglycan/LPS O-acetylase OafA/YrhL
VFVLTRPPRFLEWRWVVFLGQISYGIYVIHALFGSWLHHRFSLAQAPLIFVLQVSITVPLAAASWHFIESPILKQKWRWPMPSLKRKEKDTQSEPPMPLSAANETPG